MSEFFQTRMGQQFYDGTMRRIADALEAIAVELAAARQAKPQPHPDEELAIIAGWLDQHSWEPLQNAVLLDAIAKRLRDAGFEIRDPVTEQDAARERGWEEES